MLANVLLLEFSFKREGFDADSEIAASCPAVCMENNTDLY